MRLHRIEVANVAGIRSASLRFGPGLNVFFGPNEIGKSSLVRAIRSALLLQDSSAAAGSLVDWHADAPPTVALDFQTEEQRIWRVRKSFGSGQDGRSYLEFSRDGRTFTQEARGREVDGRLTELLRWGVDAPGGSGRRRRGVPDSFITTALLGEQAEVVAILGRGLGDDADESGKQRLTEALQAMAEHPLFRRALEAAQSKFDDAFTATGRRRSGRGSPWVRLRDDVQAAQDQQADVNERLQASDAARNRIQDLLEQLLEAQTAARDVEEERRRLETAWEKQSARVDCESALSDARRELARIEGLADSVRRTEQALEQARADLEAHQHSQKSTEEEVREAKTRDDEARARVRELESGAAEQQRRLREQEVEKRLLTLDARDKELTRQMEQAGRVASLAKRALEIAQDIGGREQVLGQARSVLEDAAASFERDRRELERLSRQRLLAHYLEGKKKSREVGARRSAAQESRTDADRLQEETDAIRREVEGWNAPSKQTLDELRSIETKLRVAEEKLKVGLTVTFAAQAGVELTSQVDGEERTASVHAGERKVFEAQRQVTFRIPAVGEIDVQGGSRDLVDTANDCLERWRASSRPVFEATRCESLAELEGLKERARTRLEQAQRIETQAAEARARAEGLEALEQDWRQASDELSRAETNLDGSLAEGTTIEAFLAEQGEEPSESEEAVQAAIADLEREVDERKRSTSDLEARVSRDEGRLESLREELDAHERDLEREREGLGDESAVLEQSQRALSELQVQRSEVQRELDAVRGEATREVDDARNQCTAAEDILAKANRASEAAKQKSDEAQMTVARIEGELAIQRKAAEREDLEAARALTRQRAAALDDLPEPEIEVTQDRVKEMQRRVEQAQSEVHALELRLRQAEGALEQVGGQYIEEHAAEAHEALIAASEREHEADIDYGAWRLLLETLKEAESEDAVHLGNILVNPISERLTALTGGRLSNLSLGPHLQTHGIELGGAPRPHEALSLGTQEQLATLLRLSIAEALGSFLVLDDQLTQSDPARMDWFRDVLRTCADAIQVVVFTCRPEDYLTADEVGRVPLDGTVCAVNLTSVVERNLAGPEGQARRGAVRTSGTASGADTPEGNAEKPTEAQA